MSYLSPRRAFVLTYMINVYASVCVVWMGTCARMQCVYMCVGMCVGMCECVYVSTCLFLGHVLPVAAGVLTYSFKIRYKTNVFTTICFFMTTVVLFNGIFQSVIACEYVVLCYTVS
jgi:hypothetical protein